MNKVADNAKIGPFSLSRIIDAPRELVYKVFTDPEHMRHWWGPKGLKIVDAKMDLRPGGIFHYGMQAPDGSVMWGRFLYRQISAPERIVFINSFSDAEGGVTRHPMAPGWPMEMLTVFTFEKIDDGRTKLNVTSSAYNASDEEIATFEEGYLSMTNGFGGTFDKLEAYLASIRKR